MLLSDTRITNAMVLLEEQAADANAFFYQAESEELVCLVLDF